MASSSTSPVTPSASTLPRIADSRCLPRSASVCTSPSMSQACTSPPRDDSCAPARKPETSRSPAQVCARRFTLRGASPSDRCRRRRRPAAGGSVSSTRTPVRMRILPSSMTNSTRELIERLVVAGVLVRDDAHLLLVPAVELELALRLLDDDRLGVGRRHVGEGDLVLLRERQRRHQQGSRTQRASLRAPASSGPRRSGSPCDRRRTAAPRRRRRPAARSATWRQRATAASSCACAASYSARLGSGHAVALLLGDRAQLVDGAAIVLVGLVELASRPAR